MDVARNRWTDEITAQVAEFANKLLSGHWHCFVLNDQLARFEQPKDHVNALDVCWPVTTYGVRRFQERHHDGGHASMKVDHLPLLARPRGRFYPHPKIIPRFTAYPNADLVTIQYVIDREWSARLWDTLIDGKRVIEIIADRCQTALNGAPFVYLINASEDKLTFGNGLRLPHVAHGINQYSNFHNAILLSALNSTPLLLPILVTTCWGSAAMNYHARSIGPQPIRAAMRINRGSDAILVLKSAKN